MPKPGLPKKYAKMGFKKGWREFKKAKRKRGTSKGQVRKTARRAYTRRNSPARPRRNMSRKMVVPHPSVTGMAAGFSIFDDLNGGNGAGVVDSVLSGNYSRALTDLGSNAQNLVKTDTGRKALVQAVGIAAIGAWARKAFPSTKLGGTKLYFRI